MFGMIVQVVLARALLATLTALAVRRSFFG
jgi:hypothetical protein